MPNAQVLETKKAKVSALADQIKNATAGVFVDYKGINVDQDTKLRNQFREAEVSDTVVKRLSYIKPGQNVWQADMPDELRIKTRTKISQIYRKLDPDKPSYTITAAGGGGTFGYHWTNRELTNRERARIQTFPDNYEFIGKYASVRKQIGMAVPPKGAEVIFNAILNTFAGIPYPYVKASLS